MIKFLRRYQKFFFAVITVVIVISFSFFGTYNVFVKGDKGDLVAFTTIDGRKVDQVEYSDLIRLIGSDCNDTLYKDSQSGAFNDGFISNDMLQTGVFLELATPYLKEISSDLDVKFEREKRFQPYAHPQAPFISIEQLWTYYAPELKNSFHEFQSIGNIHSKEALQDRIKLYLYDRTFPAAYARQMLRYQERQYNWLEPDRDLLNKDLSLFGYHSFQDWFGKKSLDLIAQYVMNVASIAKKKGYTVSNAVVRNSLMNSLQRCYVEHKRDSEFSCPNEGVYLDQTLHALGMDATRLEQAWSNVLLYRAYMQTFHSSPIVQPEVFREFHNFLDASIEVDAYRLPQAITVRTLEDVEKLEIYLNGIGDRKELLMPTKVYGAATVKKSYPELVGKHYKLRYAHVNKDELACKIGVKKTWEWQVEDANWKKLQEKFVELKQVKADTKEERYTKLHALDPKTRTLVDAYSRTQIVDEHPDWLEDAFKQNKPREVEVFLRDRGGKTPFEGIQNPIEFMRLLDAVPLNSETPTLRAYSQDTKNYYSIQVVERDNARILTYQEALMDGTLDDLLHKALDATYLKIRASKPSLYSKGNGEYKVLDEVKDVVAEEHFDSFFRMLDREVQAIKKKDPTYTNFDDKNGARAACRLHPYMRALREKMKGKAEDTAKYIIEVEEEGSSNDLVKQFYLVHSKEKTTRKEGSTVFDAKAAFETDKGSLSVVRHLPHGTVAFVRVLEKGNIPPNGELHKKIYEAKNIIGNEIERTVTRKLIGEFKEKKAIHLLGVEE